jgi:hypothetical protein
MKPVLAGDRPVAQIKEWKAQAVEAMLYEQIGRLKMDLDFFGRQAGTLQRQERLGMIAPNNTESIVRQQCALLSLNRSSLCHEAGPENALNDHLMRRLDTSNPQDIVHDSIENAL